MVGRFVNLKILSFSVMEKVSVIIRCRNEQDSIEKSIQSVLRFIPQAEILILNNNSTDLSMDIARSFLTKADMRIIDVPSYTPGKAINLGVREAKHEIILILSAHSEITKLDVSKVTHELKTHKALFGLQVPIYKGKKLPRENFWSHFDQTSRINYFSESEKRYFLHNAFCFYTRSFLTSEPFDESLSGKEDRYWAHRIVSDGFSFAYAPDIAVANHYWTKYGSTWQGTRTLSRKIIRAVYLVLLFIRVRLVMLFKAPNAWPVYVDEYLSRFGQWPRRSYFYPGSYALRVSPYNTFGHFMNITKNVEGDIAEFGVYKGDSLCAWAKNIKLMDNSGKLRLKKKVYGFDSFAGYPELTKDEQRVNPVFYRGNLGDTSASAVHRKCNQLGVGDVVQLVPGYYPDSFKMYEHLRFSQVFIDCDLYSSYKAALEYAYPRLNRGGIIVFGSYRDPRLPGATRAIDEFFSDKKEALSFFPSNSEDGELVVAYIKKQH